jgi:RimJ/RimL family protein N-acetyltransferase
MIAMHLRTKSLELVPVTRAQAMQMVEAMSPSDRAQVSADWLSQLQVSAPVDPWVHGFSLVHTATGTAAGSCGFKGPPVAGVVEIAYGIYPEHQGKGFATEAAEALVTYAFRDSRVKVVRAHTLPGPNASARVLTKCRFRCVGEVVDPDDGLVWRWEKCVA